MIKQKSLIGTRLDRQLVALEKSHFNHLASALQLKDISIPSLPNKKSPQQLEQSLLPKFMMGTFVNYQIIFRKLELEAKNILLSRESITSLDSLLCGDEIELLTNLKDIYEQKASNNPIGFVVLETVGKKNNSPAFFCERVIAVRGGFLRRQA
jgi:hypothetical protein